MQAFLASLALKLLERLAVLLGAAIAKAAKHAAQAHTDKKNTENFEESLHADTKTRDQAQLDLLNGNKPK